MNYDFYNHFLVVGDRNRENPNSFTRVLDLNLSTTVESYGTSTKIWFGEQSFVVDIPFEEVWPMWEQSKRWCQP